MVHFRVLRVTRWSTSLLEIFMLQLLYSACLERSKSRRPTPNMRSLLATHYPDICQFANSFATLPFHQHFIHRTLVESMMRESNMKKQPQKEQINNKQVYKTSTGRPQTQRAAPRKKQQPSTKQQSKPPRAEE